MLMECLPLRAPFPYFGGKSTCADVIWRRLGNVDNLIEPFCGSAAVLLARPWAPKTETLNDLDCMVANFWRATARDPEQVAAYADWPVNETDLLSRHRWLVLSEHAKEFRDKMSHDPDYYDAKVAGWWCWGLCCWIGSGWCQTPASAEWQQTPKDQSGCGGVLGKVRGENHKPLLGGNGHGPINRGVCRKRPHVGDNTGRGVLRAPPRLEAQQGVVKKLPHISDTSGKGVRRKLAHDHRPQLADAYSRGRGVHGNDRLSACQERHGWLLAWFEQLRDRLRSVRVCCGDWRRVCDSPSVTTRLGLTGIFFDPPYGTGAGRDPNIYNQESLTVAQDVREYCLERGGSKDYRICLAGYVGEGHEVLEKHGWDVVSWKSQGGYANQTAEGRERKKRERLWFSPHTLQKKQGLFR